MTTPAEDDSSVPSGDETKTTNPSLPLPSAFLQFLQENGIDSSIYTTTDTTPRYIRLKPGYESELTKIEDELRCMMEKVMWLPGFFAIPPHVQIAGSKAYRLGKIYGMDAASGAAVVALDVSPGDHVLDLCAAPGAKLCMLSDILGSSGSLTGVDVARERLAACRTMLQKYALGDRCRLFVADGTKFSLLPLRSHVDLKTYANDGEDMSDTFSEWTSKRLWKDRKKASKIRNNASKTRSASDSSTASEPELIFYGRHSGVIGLCRNEVFHEAADAIDASVSGYDRLGLLTNGFRLLRVGGSLVYSTCSLTVAQNEDVIERFLSVNASAELQGVDAAANWRCRSGKIHKTLRFDPNISQTSGLFIAKITKIAS